MLGLMPWKILERTPGGLILGGFVWRSVVLCRLREDEEPPEQVLSATLARAQAGRRGEQKEIAPITPNRHTGSDPCGLLRWRR
jgi:hypothetical protein